MAKIVDYVSDGSDFEVEYSSNSDSLSDKSVFSSDFSKYHYSIILLSQDQILQNIHPQFEFYNQYFHMVQNTQY